MVIKLEKLFRHHTIQITDFIRRHPPNSTPYRSGRESGSLERQLDARYNVHTGFSYIFIQMFLYLHLQTRRKHPEAKTSVFVQRPRL